MIKASYALGLAGTDTISNCLIHGFSWVDGCAGLGRVW